MMRQQNIRGKDPNAKTHPMKEESSKNIQTKLEQTEI